MKTIMSTSDPKMDVDIEIDIKLLTTGYEDTTVSERKIFLKILT